MTTFEKLELLLKSNPSLNILGIRYFSGPENFSDIYDGYKSNTLEGSLKLLLELDEQMKKNYTLGNLSNSIVEKVC